MKKVVAYFKKDVMLGVAVLAAIVSLFITPPSKALLNDIDWKTLATLFMLLLVLEGFKSENLFLPVINLARKMKTQRMLSSFLVFGVFFSSMFVTNDVSLIIFVPLTIILFRAGNKEHYILPVIVMENIAAVRGSLLTPFGSPQNLFLFSQSGIAVPDFLLMMLPLWLGSIVLLSIFICFLYRKDSREVIVIDQSVVAQWDPQKRRNRILYLALFLVVVVSILTRTNLWPYITLAVAVLVLIFDRAAYRRVDFALILTFLCFFIFASSIAANAGIADFLRRSVSGHEYLWSIGISQIISNVPASIVLWPFTAELKPLIYGLDTAGLVTVIGSLASVINLRIYTKEYPGNGLKFMAAFEKIDLIFFIIVFPLQLLLF